MNIGKSTCMGEIISISTLGPDTYAEMMNIIGGRVNAIQIATRVHQMPSPTDWLSIYDRQAG